jgi:MFS family permease
MEYSRRWSILFLIYFSMLAFALVFQSIPPLLGLVISALQLSHTQAGALMGLFALPGIFISIPGGMLADIY